MEAAIQIQNVWKIFGNTSQDALDAIQNKKISKQEALEKYNSVIGVSNVSFLVTYLRPKRCGRLKSNCIVPN